MNTLTSFKWRHFQAESILLCIRWYLRYQLILTIVLNDSVEAHALVCASTKWEFVFLCG